MNLDDIRKQIDEIDGQLLELFCRRMDLVKGVAAYKLENGMPVLRPEREQAILDSVSSRAGEEYGSYAAALFRCIMEVSREMQHQIIEEREIGERVPEDSSDARGVLKQMSQISREEKLNIEQKRRQEQ